MDFLNQYAGLFSLIAAVAAVVIPVLIYCKQRADVKREKQNELDSMNEISRFGSMDTSMTDFFIRKNSLEKDLKK